MILYPAQCQAAIELHFCSSIIAGYIRALSELAFFYSSAVAAVLGKKCGCLIKIVSLRLFSWAIVTSAMLIWQIIPIELWFLGRVVFFFPPEKMKR